MFVEAAAYGFHKSWGADVVVGRLGWCPRDQSHAQELAGNQRDQDLYLSAGDFGRFVRAVMATPRGFGYVLTFVTSKPRVQILLDQSEAQRVFGFEPVNQWPEGLWDYML
jgi:uronate dehydrogenase